MIHGRVNVQNNTRAHFACTRVRYHQVDVAVVVVFVVIAVLNKKKRKKWLELRESDKGLDTFYFTNLKSHRNSINKCNK